MMARRGVRHASRRSSRSPPPQAVAAKIRHGIAELKNKNGVPYVKMLDAGDTHCLPVVTAMVNPALGASYDDVDLQHAIAQEHWRRAARK